MVRYANFADAPVIQEIYAHYVRRTAITFATTEPTAADFVARISDPRYPFLAAERNGRLVGFAYADAFRQKEAFRWDVELTIYLAPGIEGQGIGSELMAEMLRVLEKQGYVNAYSCITLPGERSVALHRKFGFTQLGVFPHTGYKQGQWHDVVWMSKTLCEAAEHPDDPNLLT
ncbi:MAG: GNAT family N-acetyltransferase [Clostridiales bacterium]|nr:GNAT family N-acetyltransferase [Clostridiales bacterium]